jgi:hypothetical protein
MTAEPIPISLPTRKTRCRVRSRFARDPCPNEELDDFGACLNHLREFWQHWEDVKADAICQFPGLAKILTPAADLDVPEWVNGRPGGELTSEPAEEAP